MTLNRFIGIVLIFGFLFGLAIACTNVKDKQREIKLLTDKLWSSAVVDDGQSKKDKATKLLALMDDYIKSNPNDTIIPTYLYESARCQIYQLGDFAGGFKNLDNVTEKYPKNYLAPIALNLKAFTYDETLKEKIKAAQTYNQLIERYPQSKYAKDAAVLLQFMGKSDEEIIKILEEKNKSQQTKITK